MNIELLANHKSVFSVFALFKSALKLCLQECLLYLPSCHTSKHPLAVSFSYPLSIFFFKQEKQSVLWVCQGVDSQSAQSFLIHVRPSYKNIST